MSPGIEMASPSKVYQTVRWLLGRLLIFMNNDAEFLSERVNGFRDLVQRKLPEAQRFSQLLGIRGSRSGKSLRPINTLMLN